MSARPPLILPSSRPDTSQSGDTPRLDYFELAAALGDAPLLYPPEPAHTPIDALERRAASDIRQALLAFPQRRTVGAYVSLSEKIGLPLALLLGRRSAVPHILVAHHLTSERKRALQARTGWLHWFSRIVVLCREQERYLIEEAGVEADRVRFVWDGVDMGFWGGPHLGDLTPTTPFVGTRPLPDSRSGSLGEGESISDRAVSNVMPPVGLPLVTPVSAPDSPLSQRGMSICTACCVSDRERGEGGVRLPTGEGDPRSPLLLAVGNERRDYATLTAAARLLPDCRFVIVTGSPWSQQNKQSAPHDQPPNMCITSGLSWPDLRALYAEASAVVVPLEAGTRYSAGVNAVLEAMAMACPLVVTGTPGIAEYVDNGVSACVVPPSDPAALAEALRGLLVDPAGAARLGANARRIVAEGRNLETYVGVLVGIVREAMGNPAA